MTVNYTPLLGLAQPVTGTESGTWGDTINASLTALLETAIAGTKTADVTSGNWTLTDIDGADDTARAAVLIPTGTNGATTRSILAPNQSKLYVIINQATGSVVIKGVTGPTTGVTITSGKTTMVAWNGSDFVEITPSTISGTLPVLNGGTGATTAGTARTNLGATTIGTNVFTLANPSAITFPRFNADNTVSALDAASFRTAIGAGSGGGTVTSVSGTGTVNGLTLTGTVTSSGSLTLGGTFALTWAIKTTTYTAVAGDNILADTTSGAFTITLPASASVNDTVSVADYKGTFATNNLTVNSNGLNLMGSVQTLVLNVNYRNVTLVYSGATQGWVIVL